MVDPREDKELICEEGSEVKSCVDCGATKTPLWRSGPAGPKSLCNACGIKSRKRKGTAVSGVTKSSTEEKKAKKLGTNTQNVTSSSSSNNDNEKQSNGNKKGNGSNANSKSSQLLKKNLAPLGQEVVFQRSIAERLRRRPGEDEQAAMLLLALSGCAY